MKTSDKEKAINEMVNLVFKQPTLADYGKACVEVLQKYGAFQPLEEANMSFAIRGNRITSI